MPFRCRLSWPVYEESTELVGADCLGAVDVRDQGATLAGITPSLFASARLQSSLLTVIVGRAPGRTFTV